MGLYCQTENEIGIGYWILDIGYWILKLDIEIGYWILDILPFSPLKYLHT